MSDDELDESLLEEELLELEEVEFDESPGDVENISHSICHSHGQIFCTNAILHVFM